MSYEFRIGAKDRAAGRFIGAVKKALLRAALFEKQESGVTQQSIAQKLGVNRSVIHRMLKGEANLTLRSVAEIAWALGWEIDFTLKRAATNVVTSVAPIVASDSTIVVPKQTELSAEEISVLLKNAKNIQPIAVESRVQNDNYAPVEVAA
jgi:DNA-binding phage protein